MRESGEKKDIPYTLAAIDTATLWQHIIKQYSAQHQLDMPNITEA